LLQIDTVQSWQTRSRRIGIVGMAAVFVIILTLVFHAGQFKGITNVNAMDYGQVAWNLAQGRGYTTNLIRPLSLAHNNRIDGHPELTYAPLHPYIASLFMRVMGDKGKALALSGGLGFLLCVPVVFFLGWQLFDLRTGILSSALFATSLVYLRYSISGLEVTWMTLWVSLLFLTLHTLSRKARWRPHLSVAAGVLMALVYLTQYLWAIILPLVAVFILLSTDRRTRGATLGLFLAAFFVVILPWCVRNVRVAGNPFFTFHCAESVMMTRSHPGNTLYRQFTTDVPSWIGYAFTRPMEVIQKVRSDVETLYPVLLTIGGLFVTPFFLVGSLVTLGSATFERLRYLWYFMYLAVFTVAAFVLPSDRFLIPLGPVAGVIGVGLFFRLMDTKVGDLAPREHARYMGIGVAALVILQCLPLTFTLFRGATPEAERLARIEGTVREVAGLTNGPIITDVPWLVAWFADRPAIWLPKTVADLKNLQDKVGKVRWLLLTPQVVDENYDWAERTRAEWGPAWTEGIRGDIDFQGYRVYKRIAEGDWLLFVANPAAAQDLPPDVLKQYQQQGSGQGAGSSQAPATPSGSAP
jgi:hypothetical protein